MQLVKFTLLFSIFTFANACSQAPGTTTTIVTTTITTASSDDGDHDDDNILRSRERSIIRKTWDQARRDDDVAPQILFRFLKAHPDYQRKFSKFANVAQSDLMTNGNFLVQSYTILAGLNIIIHSMSNQERLESEMFSVGIFHYYSNVTAAMFQEFGAVVQEVLADKLGSSFDAEARSAWKNGIRALVIGIAKNLEMPNELPFTMTKLIPYQIRAVQINWEDIRADRNDIVSSIFVRLFKESPRAQEHFTKFSGVDVDALTSDPEFNKQVGFVADRLDTIIVGMNDVGQFLGNIEYLRYSHQPPRNIPRDRFEDFARLLLNVLASKGVSSNVLDSWKGVMTVFVDSISPRK